MIASIPSRDSKRGTPHNIKNIVVSWLLSLLRAGILIIVVII